MARSDEVPDLGEMEPLRLHDLACKIQECMRQMGWSRHYYALEAEVVRGLTNPREPGNYGEIAHIQGQLSMMQQVLHPKTGHLSFWVLRHKLTDEQIRKLIGGEDERAGAD